METSENIKLYENKIRRQWNEKTKKWYFSIVDVIAIVTKSTDPRNYWKVLKNRLKKGQNELVTQCNQLKMKSNDGKFYLTDTADGDTMLKILKIVSTTHFSYFKHFLSNLENIEPEVLTPKSSFEEEESDNTKYDILDQEESYPHPPKILQKEEHFEEEFLLLIDAYLEKNYIIVKAFIAGVEIEDISILATHNTLTIKGERKKENKILEKNYRENELYWGKFSRAIKLPHHILTDNVEATAEDGMLLIKLPLMNKNFSQVVKVKNI